MNIILIGMRGAGKSNVSRRLAVLTKRNVLSTDLMIEYENGGKSIAEIIAQSNNDWRAFRDQEYAVVQKVTQLDGAIIDCGGGVIVDLDENGNEVFSDRKVEALRKTGKIVWLKGDIARLAAKTQADKTRPNLDETRSAEEVMRRRLPFYKKAADIVVDIEGKTRSQLAKKIYRKLEAEF